jgi:chemotaxis protein CheD
MNPYNTKIPVIYLKPGEIYITEKPTLVATILGSCVSVTMFNPRLRIGAICHGILPSGKDATSCDDNSPDEFKYVDYSIEKMFERYEIYGVTPDEIEVKLFGGAEIITSKKGSLITISIGTQNIQTAILALKSKGLKLHVSHVGGVSGRKLLFYTHTGEVFLKYLSEKEYSKNYNR